jgi:CRAL/TRIO domain
MIIIGAPSIFRYAWAVARNFFRQSMRRKMIFASKNYLEVLDEFIPREVLPPSIVEGGLGRVAMGMPPLIGDREEQSLSSDVTLTKEGLKAIYSSFETSVSLAETDDESATSDDLPCSACSVSGSALCKGVWVDHDAGGSKIVFRSNA